MAAEAGSGETATTFTSAAELADALRRAAEAHHAYEQRTGEPDADWAGWYAEHMVAEAAGRELPS